MSQETILRPSRKFLGGLSGFTSKEQRNFQKAHLKAYLAGRQTFMWGWVEDDETGIVQRSHHLVARDLNPVPMENPESRATKRFIKKHNLV